MKERHTHKHEQAHMQIHIDISSLTLEVIQILKKQVW